MTAIRNIWNEVNSGVQENRENGEITPLDILREQEKAINKDVEKTNILSLLLTVSIKENNVVEKIKHTLYLLPRNGNDYNYRFIEIEQNVDNIYPVTVYAFQSGNTNFGECHNNEEFYEVLLKIFNDPRKNIVFRQLREIGDSIENWEF